MSWTHLRDGRPKARKSHRCFLCGEAIEVGETYVRRSGISDDRPYSFAMHPECEAEAKRWDEMDWECFCEGDMPRPGSDAAREAEERIRIVGEREMAEAIKNDAQRFRAMGEDLWDV